jgi:hypothetical protein
MRHDDRVSSLRLAELVVGLGQPRQIVSDWLMELAPGAAPLTRLRVAGTAIVRSGQTHDGYATANCEVVAAIGGIPSSSTTSARRTSRSGRTVCSSSSTRC